MPVHVEEMTSEVAVLDGDLPLSEKQMEKLATLVLQRLAEKKRAERQVQEATVLRRQARPSLPVAE